MAALLLLALFIGVPVLEISLFITMGQQIGLGGTLGLIILTAVIGTVVMRAQGLATMARVQQSMRAGQMPVDDVIAGFFLLVAGLLLLTPGFFTDAIGFLLLVPALRAALGKAALAAMLRHGTVHMSGSMNKGGFSASWPPGQQSRPGRAGPRDAAGDVIDGDFQDLGEKDQPSGPELSGPSSRREDS